MATDTKDASKKKQKPSLSKKPRAHDYPEYLTAAYNPTRFFPRNTGETPSKAAEKLMHSMAENGPALSSSIERFVSAFEKSSKRWEMVVYPVMFAFALLASYGFYLIYSLTHDMHVMTYSITHMSSTIDNMSTKLDPIHVMGKDINAMSANINNMSNKIVSMDKNIGVMSNNVQTMNTSIGRMSQDMGRVGYDMNNMSRQIVKPMSFFNSFMP